MIEAKNNSSALHYKYHSMIRTGQNRKHYETMKWVFYLKYLTDIETTTTFDKIKLFQLRKHKNIIEWNPKKS